MNNIVLDIETSSIPKYRNIDVEKLYCICIKYKDETISFSEKKSSYIDGDYKDFLEIVSKIDTIIGHNIVKFDIPVLNKFLPNGISNKRVLDTLLISQLMYSKNTLCEIDSRISNFPKELVGSYSLKAFGYRLGDYKISFDDFNILSREMVEYCKQDINLTHRLFKSLKLMEYYPLDRVIEVEHKFASIIANQENYGFYFDINKARKLAVNLQFNSMNLEHKLQKIFPPKYIKYGDIISSKKDMNRKKYYLDTKYIYNILFYKRNKLIPLRKPKRVVNPITGLITTVYYKPFKGKFFTKKHNLIVSLVGGEYQKIKLQKFNPASRLQIIDRLKELGWKPISYSDKGNPQLNEDVLNYSIKKLKEKYV